MDYLDLVAIFLGVDGELDQMNARRRACLERHGRSRSRHERNECLHRYGGLANGQRDLIPAKEHQAEVRECIIKARIQMKHCLPF